MLHLYGAEDDTVRYDGEAGSDGFIYTTAKDTATEWAANLACAAEPSDWRNKYTEDAGVECLAYSGCRVTNQTVISCKDADGLHEWPGYTPRKLSPTCVTEEQFESMPGQQHCGEPDSSVPHFGMDLAWAFMSQYRQQP